MEQHIEPKTVLLAAEKIRSLGELKEGVHHYQQMRLEIGYDGYTIKISDGSSALTVFFHNTVKTEYKRQQDLEDFYKRLQKLADEN